ncbi:MAG TPA: quinone-dependent dihydroorotate dehydrogenase [Flavisolibacter sp.]|nr:quinone-dependent dihydroorotate dehydrogenase [Flavisolibacter sp.]
MYRFIRQILFLLPAETAHYLSMNCLKALCSLGFIRNLLQKTFTLHSPFTTHLFGLSFKNPVGLGAGFDKNAKYLRELETLGFGFIEIGTVTPRPQAGNDKPRLFRLPKDKALINRMGFNNDGVDVITQRLKQWRKKKQQAFDNSQLTSAGNYQPLTTNHKPQTTNLLIGGNIGKNKTTPNEEAWKDYESCFRALHTYVDFFVVNVSSPNTPGLRELQEKESLRKILTHLQELNKTFTNPRPILLKIAPDLTNEQIDDVISLATEISLDGLVATNTTISRDNLQTANTELQTIGAGGLSGKPVERRSTEVVQYIHQKTGGKIPVIGSGGIFTGADAANKLAAGAALVEVWTGFIYEGPFIVWNICKQLKQTMQK